MKSFTHLVSWLFGSLLIALSIFVSLETLIRKLFNFSFQGADELGGYVLALGGTLSFTVALLERGHIRIDLIHERLPSIWQAVLNWLSAFLLAVFGVFLAKYCLLVIKDTVEYGSVAPTAWATPMVYPQTAWFVCIVLFACTAVWLAVKATGALITGNFDVLNRDFQPKGAMEELDEELSDLKRR